MKKKMQGFTGTVVKQIHYDVYVEVEIDEDDPMSLSESELRDVMLEKAKEIEKNKMEDPYAEEYSVVEEDIRIIH